MCLWEKKFRRQISETFTLGMLDQFCFRQSHYAQGLACTRFIAKRLRGNIGTRFLMILETQDVYCWEDPCGLSHIVSGCFNGKQ